MAVAPGDIAVISGSPAGEGGASSNKASIAYVIAAADANGDVQVCDLDSGKVFLVPTAAITAKVTPVAP